jgi:hypothetical protein
MSATDPLFDDSKAPVHSGRAATNRPDENYNGVTNERQRTVLNLLAEAKTIGITWLELSQKTGWHHGQTSVLSDLHKAGLISRLAGGKRARSSVYVLPEYVNGKPTAEYNGRKVVVEGEKPRTVPALSVEQDELVEKLRDVLPQYKDRGVIPLRVPTVQELLDIIKILSGR